MIKPMVKWQKRILLTSWITYASFYLIRVNMSVAIPGIKKDFGISNTAIGWILTASFLTYAMGQFINGQLGDKFGARRIVALGLLCSSILNIMFGFTGNLVAYMILIWALNGFFQSMGWAPIIKITASWFPINKRGKAAGILGSSYQIGNVISWILAGFIVSSFGWRWVFWIPAGITILSSINWYFRIRESAEDEGFDSVEKAAKRPNGIRNSIELTLRNKKLWVVAFALFSLNVVRYGFLSWAPTYFFEVQKASISLSVYRALVFPLAGSAGAISAGWISDKFFRSKRTPVTIIMLMGLILAIWIFPRIPVTSWVLSLVILVIIGFTVYGPHMMLVTVLPMDLGTKGMASSATGFVDGWGYVGAALTGVGTGFLLDNFGWNYVFYFWLFGAIIATVLMAILGGMNRSETVENMTIKFKDINSKTKEEIMVENLKDTKEILDKHHIRFWLDWGTLLGAVREGKIIEWDHDVDLGMMESDFKKINSILYEFEKKRFCLNKFPVIKTNFHLYLTRLGYAIDIWPYKTVGKDTLLTSSFSILTNSIAVRILWFLWCLLAYNGRVELPINKFKLIVAVFIKFVFKISVLPFNKFKKYSFNKLSQLLVEKHLIVCPEFAVPKCYFERFRNIEFYDVIFNIPFDAEEYLKYKYGKDWKIPRKEWNWIKEDGARLTSEPFS